MIIEATTTMDSSKNKRVNNNSISVHSLLTTREIGRCSSHAFDRKLGSLWEQQRRMLQSPEVVSPHRNGIRSLSFDRVDGRFLLCGSFDSTVSIYDISKWGSEGFVRNRKKNRKRTGTVVGGGLTALSNVDTRNDEKTDASSATSSNTFRPIARSLRVPSVLSDPDESSLPAGHCSSLTHVQWYPVDTGAFISASMDGTLLVWDTNRMEPVFSTVPFRPQVTTTSSTKNSSSLSCVHLGGNEASLVATASWNDCHIKLVDLRSGASTHQLVGNDDAVSCLQWSPTSSVILASGSRDGMLRLWDIRKSGSRACITQLHQQSSSSSWDNVDNKNASVLSYSADYSHLSKMNVRQRGRKRRLGDTTVTAKLKSNVPTPVAPNNYNHVQSKGHLFAHNGVVSSLSFFPTGHFLASVGGRDGELLLWDLRHPSKIAVPIKFVTSDGQTAAGIANNASRGRRKIPLLIDKKSCTVWVGHQSDLLGFSIEGGTPVQVLKGHLHTISAVERIDQSMQLLTGSADGMILTWGKDLAASERGHPKLLEDRDSW